MLTAAEPAPGDRGLPIHQVYPPEAFYHNGKGGRVLDVTRPPFNAKGDGVTDDTQSLVAAMRFVREHYEQIRGPDFAYCGKKENRNWVIYLPDGEYRVSDTISQGWPALAITVQNGWNNVRMVKVDSLEHEVQLNPGGPKGMGSQEVAVYAEANWSIRIVGQSRKKP